MFFYVSYDLIHDRQAKVGYFDIAFNKLPIVRSDYADIGLINKPLYYADMVKIAKDISKDFPFVRVDFFAFDNYFKFAELTFTPGAAMMPLNPSSFDLEWGEYLKLC